MAIVVFYKKRGPTVVEKLPKPELMGDWTYALVNKVWHWVVQLDSYGYVNKEWMVVDPSKVPKEYKAWGLLLG